MSGFGLGLGFLFCMFTVALAAVRARAAAIMMSVTMVITIMALIFGYIVGFDMVSWTRSVIPITLGAGMLLFDVIVIATVKKPTNAPIK